MAHVVLLPMFIVAFVVCVWALDDLGSAKYFVALCVALLAAIGVARQPEIIKILELPYQALAIVALAIGLVWLLTQFQKKG